MPIARTAASLRGGMPAAWSLEPFQRFAEQTLEETWRLTVGIDASAGAEPLEALLARALGFGPREGAEAVLSRSPDLRGLLDRYPLLEGGGVSPLARAAALGEYRTFLGGVTGSVRDALSGEANGNEGASPASLENLQKQALDWATRRSFVYLASRSELLSGGDAGVMGRIRTIGNAAVDLRHGAATFHAQLASAGQRAAMLALGGNVFAVTAQLTSFFGLTPGGLGPEAANDVRVIRATVDTLRQELHERFDRVEASLDTVLSTLDTRFVRLEQLVQTGNRGVQADLASLHRDVMALGQRVERMEESLASYMQAGFDRDYSRTLIRCLEHRERLLPPFDEMDFATFSECLADFRARAVQDARDALLSDQTTATDDESLAAALADTTADNLTRRLPLLTRAAEQRFGYTAMRGGRGVGNPREWAVATQAYLTLLLDWPEHARSVAPGDLEAMRGVGCELSETLRAITADGSGSRGTLLGAVLASYDRNVAELGAEAEVLAERHQQAQLRRVPPESVVDRLEPLEPGGSVLEVPSAIAARLPQELRTAAVVGIGEASLVYRFVAEDSISRENFRRRFLLFGKRHERLTFTRTHIEVELRFSGQGTVASYRTSGPMVLGRTETMSGGEGSEEVGSVAEHVPDPDAHFLAEAWPALVADAGVWRSVPPRPETLRTLEAAVEAELRRHASTALDNVFTTVCAADPSAPQLEGADARSAERILGALRGMTAARRLLGAYVLLGFPDGADGTDPLRERLFGADAILDHAALCGAVAAGESPLRLIWLDDEPAHRSAALAGALSSALAGTEEALPFTLVDATLQPLDAALRVQRLRALAARAGG